MGMNPVPRNVLDPVELTHRTQLPADYRLVRSVSALSRGYPSCSAEPGEYCRAGRRANARRIRDLVPLPCQGRIARARELAAEGSLDVTTATERLVPQSQPCRCVTDLTARIRVACSAQHRCRAVKASGDGERCSLPREGGNWCSVHESCIVGCQERKGR
jgi:hypothetical protein